MFFAWDPAKAERNLAKHGIALEEAWEFDWAGAVVVDWSSRIGRVAPMVRRGKQLSGSCTAVFARLSLPTGRKGFG